MFLSWVHGEIFQPRNSQKELYFADSSRIIQKTDASKVCCGWNNICFRDSPQCTAGCCLKKGWWEGKWFTVSKIRRLEEPGHNENKVHRNICLNLLLLHLRGTAVPHPSEFLHDIWNMLGEKEKRQRAVLPEWLRSTLSEDSEKISVSL